MLERAVYATITATIREIVQSVDRSIELTRKTVKLSRFKGVEALGCLLDMIYWKEVNAMASRSSGSKSGGSSRSAITGRFVTGSYAKSHPKTTVTSKKK